MTKTQITLCTITGLTLLITSSRGISAPEDPRRRRPVRPNYLQGATTANQAFAPPTPTLQVPFQEGASELDQANRVADNLFKSVANAAQLNLPQKNLPNTGGATTGSISAKKIGADTVEVSIHRHVHSIKGLPKYWKRTLTYKKTDLGQRITHSSSTMH